jgi:hypothetical protein
MTHLKKGEECVLDTYGDMLSFAAPPEVEDSQAYGYSMGSNYNQGGTSSTGTGRVSMESGAPPPLPSQP